MYSYSSPKLTNYQLVAAILYHLLVAAILHHLNQSESLHKKTYLQDLTNRSCKLQTSRGKYERNPFSQETNILATMCSTSLQVILPWESLPGKLSMGNPFIPKTSVPCPKIKSRLKIKRQRSTRPKSNVKKQ